MSKNLSILNDVIHTLKDGQEGFRVASQDVQALELKELFSKYSVQRSEFAEELQTLARDLGEQEPANSGSAAGALHRGWIDLKAALVAKDEHAVLAECERGEDVAVANYEKALESPDLTLAIRSALEAQFKEIQSAHDNIKTLRDATKVR